MPLTRPEAGCHEIDFETPHAVDEAGEVALEDYARALTRARAAEAVRATGVPGAVRGVHVCGVADGVSAAARRDLEGFAHSLALGTGGGLGWS